jgi:translocation and assembly module TamA
MEQALGNSPYWSRVEVHPDRSAANGTMLPIVVDLTPAKPGKYTVGAGFGTDDGAHVRSLIELRRLNRAGHRGQIQGTLSNIEQSGEFQYIIPWPYPRTDVLTLGTGYTQQNVASIDEKAYHVGVDLSRLWAGWQYAFGLQFRRQQFTVGLDHGIGHFLVPSGNWSRLLADDPVDPKKGWRLLWHIEGAQQSVLSTTSYARLDGHARWLHPLGGNTGVLARADLGWLGTNAFHRLPPSARFFAGGANSVRGYGYNELGPQDIAGHTIGGEVLEIASLEYNVRFGRQWGAAVFYDTGNAMTRFGGTLAQGAGPGIRWVSPVGIVRLDYGFPLSTSTHRGTVHISIGPAL